MRKGHISHRKWFRLLCNSYKKEGIQYLNRPLPGFPDENTQLNTVGAVGKDNLREANAFFQDCVARFQSSANWSGADKRIVDFGCGWGRITRFFLRDFEPVNIIGIDIDSDLLEICRTTFSGVKFYQCDPFPPSVLEDESIDFIVGYSVFSHLSEDACLNWMQEFKRVIKPGGRVAVTTRGRPFFDYCLSLKNKPVTGYSQALSNLFPNFDEAKKRYDNGQLVHSNVLGVTGGGIRSGEFYGETFIPRKYAQDVLSNYLDFVEYVEGAKLKHPILVFEKSKG